jgi:sulfite reductase alpha subunit-like flavoprotein|tara:strand:- start:40 stop:420 length:381 start_codon:yes stop_codon:yes gene_type:complete
VQRHLFFGCRSSAKDYIFEAELARFESEGLLTKLHTAFSRDQATKVYVQHRLREAGAVLAQLILEEGAFIYVCGDGQRMAADVHRALEDVLAEHGKVCLAREGVSASEKLAALAERGAYVRDVWSP